MLKPIFLLILMVMALAACATNSEPPVPTESAVQPLKVIVEQPTHQIIEARAVATKFPTSTLIPTATLIPTETPYMSDLRNFGAAPELHDGLWLNTDTPLKLADLRGKVVLLEMWTFDCINCIHVVPSLIDWHEIYGDEGLVIIGNHYPEFSYEADFANLEAAVERLGIEYPVLQDNDRQTWAAYNNRYWPTIYLIDKWGNIRYKHIGEGAYAQTNEAIQELLKEDYTG